MNDTFFCYKSVMDQTKCMSSSAKTGMYVVGVCNAVLALPTAAANALVIVAILTTSSLRTPSYLLLTSLAFSDLTVGICTQSILSAILIDILITREICVYLLAILAMSAVSTSCVSVLTLTAISVDRYLAIRLKMRYRSVVTARRVRYFIVSSWIIAVSITCYIMISKEMGQIFRILAIVSISTCLLVILCSYTMSFRALRIYCAQTYPQGNQQQPNSTTQSNAIDVLKYRKLLKTMVLVFIMVIVCYLPLIALFSILIRRLKNSLSLFWFFLSIVSLHSTINPFIYITRMTDLRRACIRVLNISCFKSNPTSQENPTNTNTTQPELRAMEGNGTEPKSDVEQFNIR